MKIRSFLFAMYLLLINSSFLRAQDTLPDIEPGFRPQGRFYIGGFISPDLSYSSIPRENTGNPAIKDFRSNYDIPKFSVTVGLDAMYQITEHLAVTLGLQYSGKGGKTSEIEYHPSLAASDPVNMYYVYDYRFIDIPLRLDLYFTKTKVSPFITAGVSTNILVDQRTHSFGIDQSDNELEYSSSGTSGFSTVSPQLQLGAGVDIALKASRLRIFPLYRLTLADANLGGTYSYPGGYSSGVVKGKLYSIGLGISYLVRL